MPLLYTSLFNRRFLNQRTSAQVTPPDHKKLMTDWAETIRNGTLRKQKETEARGPFIQRFFVEILGYQPFGSGPSWTINDEKRTGGGSADTALGHFNAAGKSVIAPVELKGADTPDLDAIMPGRHKSPVQQVWEYAMDTPGCQFLLVSNMLEFRLYAVGQPLLYDHTMTFAVEENELTNPEAIGLFRARTEMPTSADLTNMIHQARR